MKNHIIRIIIGVTLSFAVGLSVRWAVLCILNAKKSQNNPVIQVEPALKSQEHRMVMEIKGEDKLSMTDPTITIMLIDGRKIVINFDTGRVTYKGIKLDDASATFWDNTVLAYPAFRKRIIQSYLKEMESHLKEEAKK